MISDAHKARIRRRMSGLAGVPLEAGEIFYAALFRQRPELAVLFGDDIGGQSEKLVDMVHLVVHFLDAVEALKPEIEALGERHLGYGLRPSQLAAGKAALLEALAGTLDEWTREDHEAWDALFTELLDLMLIGLARAAAAAPLRSTG